MKIHEKYINRCIRIAKNGLGTTAPNPMVGCTIVENDRIIGEGFTSPYGGNHAEVNAINSVRDISLLKKATLYVTLEPCSHFGKTPPCADLIIAHQIPNVVIGILDPHSKVCGNGIKKLRDAGCNVTVGVLEAECLEHHKRFLTFHNRKRPYIILKWAETRDNFVAPDIKNHNRPIWVTNEFSRQLVHKWRTEEQAILVGANTVLADNPRLDARDWSGTNPTRIVIDKNNGLGTSHEIFNAKANTLHLTENQLDFSRPLAIQVCNFLYRKSINSLIVEGGPKTLQMFLDENLWDEARIFIGQTTFGTGIHAPKINGKPTFEKRILKDRLLVYHNNTIH
ncbi:MAG TPA: bifunctional diaminohydroxyphosphoribosylaminopyrimidine deaminase/5-amino-6-(5-phosphoribosylamino)uracil reductase RibD [Aquaticitalea sp.]|nr:bifunctional diaminohydroxyphosphoribosylaminopyrimidine deaminase/5-amino-6-(5-phosphoribosylamino)uracil reductase RibD [Aquaticitalea sp.]